MIAPAEIRQLTLKDKLALLEAVWCELAAEPEILEVPEWHKELLDERDEALRDGRIKAIEWETAKGEIQSATR